MAAASTKADPVHATLLAILKQLNQAETVHEGATSDQALELPEIERRLSDFWAIDNGSVKLGLALGLLLRNGLVANAAARRGPAVSDHSGGQEVPRGVDPNVGPDRLERPRRPHRGPRSGHR
ncbi:MAG: hypothetical protein L3J86_04595 [Thermoplasmata archaeon]|nr:hypothetical protein [Thermoplasmata archaeon]